MRTLLDMEDSKELERRCDAGYNHTYKYTITIDELPQPAGEYIDAWLRVVNHIAAISGAEVTVEQENV